jgi:hypothetical protein
MNSKVGLFSIIIVLTLFGNANAQKGSFSFEQEKAHVLYGREFKNPLKISGTSKFDSLTVEYDYYDPIYSDEEFEQMIVLDSTLMKGIGRITKGSSDNTYSVQVGSRGVNTRLNFHLDGKVIESREYKIIQVPDPIVKFGMVGHSDAAITHEELRGIKSLTCERIDWEYDEKYEVEGFTYHLSGPSYAFMQQSSSADLTPEMKKALSKASVGDAITVTNIIVSLSDVGIYTAKSICVKITD